MSDRKSQFTLLLTQHGRQLFNYIYVLVRNLDDAHDLFQQTSLVLWEKFDTYRPGTNFFAWGCQVARYKVMDFNKRRRGSFVPLSEAIQDQLLTAASVRPADEWDERAAALEKCVQKLSEAQRKLLHTCYCGLYSVRQVAEQLSRRPDSIHGSLRHLRLRLLDCVRRSLAREQA